MKQRQAVSAGAALATLLAMAFTLGACSGGEEDPLSCESSEECPDGQVCRESLCVEDDNQGNQFNQNQSQNQEEGIVEEQYLVSFLAKTRLQPIIAEARLVGSRDNTDVELLTADIDCTTAFICQPTRNLSHFLIIDSAQGSDGNYDVWAAPIDAATLSLEGSPQLLLEGVYNPRLRGDGIIFNRAENDTFFAYYHEPASGSETQIATLHQVGASPPRYWDADPDANTAVVYVPTLDTLDVWIGQMSRGVSQADHIHTFDRNNLPGSAGSLYIGELPTGFSSDGRYVAMSANGPNAHSDCSTDADCTGTSQVCGTDNRCVAREVAIHVIDLDWVETLGDNCTGHDACGPVHRCDSRYENFDGGQCAPQLTVFGVPHLPQQAGQYGCDASRADGSFSYTRVRAPFSWGPDDRFYLVGERECVRGPGEAAGAMEEANMPLASILALDIETGEYEEIFGNRAGEDFDDARCYDEDERATDIEDCTVLYISHARLSPDGNDIIFLGTNPSVSAANQTDRILDIWRINREGEDHDWLGETATSREVRYFQVHSDPRVQEEEEEEEE